MITDLTTRYFNALENNIRERFPIDVVNVLERLDPPGMRRRSDVSFRSHIGRNVADHAETSSQRCD